MRALTYQKTSYTVKRILKEVKKGNFNLNNPIQRPPVWDKDRRSLFIDTVITGQSLVLPLTANKITETKVWDIMDGIQRINTLVKYVNDEFNLTDIVSTIDTENEDDFELEGLKFSELPEELQDKILDFSVDIYIYEDLTEDEQIELFRRLNNGKSLTADELMFSQAVSRETMFDIGQHEIFNFALKKEALEKRKQIALVKKAYVSLYVENPSFETKALRNIIQTAVITDEQKDTINACFTKIMNAYKMIKDYDNEDADVNKTRDKICKRMLSNTHLTSLVSLAVDNNINSESLAQFCIWFFGSSKTTTNMIYNVNSTNGTASASKVQTRMTEIVKSYHEFNKNKNTMNIPEIGLVTVIEEQESKDEEIPEQEDTNVENEVNEEIPEQEDVQDKQKEKEIKELEDVVNQIIDMND